MDILSIFFLIFPFFSFLTFFSFLSSRELPRFSFLSLSGYNRYNSSFRLFKSQIKEKRAEGIDAYLMASIPLAGFSLKWRRRHRFPWEGSMPSLMFAERDRCCLLGIDPFGPARPSWPLDAAWHRCHLPCIDAMLPFCLGCSSLLHYGCCNLLKPAFNQPKFGSSDP